LRQEKVKLEQTLEQEQEQQVSKLMRKISKLEKETATKQMTLDQVCVCVSYISVARQFSYFTYAPHVIIVGD